MAKSPAFPESTRKDLPPFLNDGQSTVEFVEGQVVDGPPQDPVPAYVFDVKIIESNNPMNTSGQTYSVRIKCKGWSWGENVKEIISAAGLLSRASISPASAEALFQTGRLKGRKFAIVQETKSGPSRKNPGELAVWREYKCAPLEKTPVI